MIFNEHLDRLMDVGVVQDFMRDGRMQGRLCGEDGNHSFILYRRPYVVVFQDALIENYLDIQLFDLNARLMIRASTLCGWCLDMGLQGRNKLRQWNFDNDPLNNIFLSEGATKMNCLHSHLEAVALLLPLIEASGGLSSMRNGTFDARFDFSASVQPTYPGLEERYLKCIDCSDSPSNKANL